MFSLRGLLRSANDAIRKTALYDLHKTHGGKMVDFAGWYLPVQYNDFGIIDSCLHTRSKASLFDVSHMGQLEVSGTDRVRFIESLVVSDIQALGDGESRLSVFTTPTGGILDDTVITKKPDSIHLVLNAGRVDVDMQHIRGALSKFDGDVELNLHRDKSLIALQGPEAVTVLQPLIDGKFSLAKLPFMSAVDLVVADQPGCTVSRSGYTGEDGFEISIPNNAGAIAVTERILESGKDIVMLAGLGARDALRVEAGLCLYGSDIDETISPVEAGLSWTVTKSRRINGSNSFPGASTILNQIAEGVARKRVGFTILNGPPARHGNKIYHPSDAAKPIGEITSGTFSPSLGKSIAIGYVATEHAKIGSEFLVDVRGKLNPLMVTKMPFVPNNYYRGPNK